MTRPVDHEAGDGAVPARPLVTVAISAYNPGRYMLTSLESVLTQTYSAIEIFLVDDGSRDGSVDDALAALPAEQRSRIRLIRQSNSGKSVGLNRILDECSGDLFMIHDADDISHPQRVERQVACLIEHPELVCCLTRHELVFGKTHFAARQLELGAAGCADVVQRLKVPALDPTAMFRLSMVGHLRFDPELLIGQGTDFILRVAEQHPMMVIGDSLYSYRINFGSNTRRNLERTAYYEGLVRERALERRGADTITVESPAPRRGQHAFVSHVIEATLDARVTGNRLDALRAALTCSRLRPLQMDAHKPLVYALVPMAVLKRMRPDRVLATSGADVDS